jgi:hypothetical protein
MNSVFRASAIHNNNGDSSMIRIQTAVAASIALLLFAAQTRGQVELKPAVGLTFTTTSKDPLGGEAKGQVGWQIGGTVLFGEKLYGETGLFYAKKSTEFTSATTNFNFESGITGLRIPALLGYHLLGSEKDMLGLRIFGGGTLFLVTSVDAQGMSKDDFESPTFGVFAGAGLDIAIFFLDIKYEWSLTDVSTLSTVDIGKSRSLFANAGIRLPL